MMSSRIYKVEGIILKRKNVGETDRIITVFTKEYGKLRVIAKGIRKITSRRAPHLEVFTRMHAVIHSGKSLDSISEVVPIMTFQVLRGDLRRLSLAYYLCELVDSLLPEKQEHRDVFSLLSQTLDKVSTERNIYKPVKAFTLELLWALGFLPRGKSLDAKSLQPFIENITERPLKSPHFARRLISE